MEHSPYNDEWATCAKTFATLRIYSAEASPEEVTRLLNVRPTTTRRRGELRGDFKLPHNCWLLCSDGFVESKDVRRHIDWVLDRIEPASSALASLVNSGARADVSCYWHSKSNQGGPTISPRQARRLAELELECGFDIYPADDDEVIEIVV